MHDTLKAIFVIQRHGDRAPDEGTFLPDDPFQDKVHWPNGIGGLTDRGRTRMANVGRFLRKRYAHFLTDDIGEANMVSSPSHRCQESGRCVVSGVYQANNLTNDELSSFPMQIDGKMLRFGIFCPKFESIQDLLLRSDESKKFQSDFKDIFDLLTIKCRKEIDWYQTVYLCNTILIENEAGLPLPAWLTPSIVERMDELRSRAWSWWTSPKEIRLANEMRELLIGVFLADLKRKLENVGSDSLIGSEMKKLNLYETHDFMVTACLASLGVNDGRYPPFGATLIFELHNESGGSNSIRIFYLNETETEIAHRLRIPGCEDPCTVEQFVSRIAPLSLSREEFDQKSKLADS